MRKNKYDCDLNSCFLCKMCLKEWVPAIEANRQTYKVKKGEVIFREGDAVKGIYFVYAGSFKVHKQWGANKELIVRFANKGAILGHRGLGTDLHYPVSATALEAAIVCCIDIDFFMTTLKVNNDLTFNLLLFFADELKDSERKMRNLAHMSVKGRVAQALITLRNKFGLTDEGYIDIALTRQDLASYAGATYETVFRIINELVQGGSIMVKGRNILITNEEKLTNLTLEIVPAN